MEKEFIKFLKERRLFTKFKSHVKEYHYSGRYSFESLLRDLAGSPRYFVLSGFTWRETPEGENYWNNISSEWKETVKTSETS